MINFDPEKGYATTDDPFMPITAISCYMNWTDQLVTFAMPPKAMNMQQAKMQTERFSNCMLFEKEKDKEKFLYTIEFYPEEGKYHMMDVEIVACLFRQKKQKQKK